MKESLSSFDVAAALKDLQPLAGGHLDKVYHPDRGHLILSIRGPSGEKAFVHFHVGKWLYRSDKNVEDPGQPSDFAMMLRKRISNAKIVGLRQQGFDRIAVITLEKDGPWDLVLELFGDGNVILVKDGAIVQPLTGHKWKHRDVRAKSEFSYPPPVPDPRIMSPEGFLEILRSSDADIVRTLATKLNLGGRYSEEIVLRTGLDRSAKAAATDIGQAGAILDAIKGFSQEVAEGRGGYLVLKDGTADDVVPVRMRTYDRLVHEQFDTFSSAVEAYASREPKPLKEKPAEEEKELGKLQRKVAQQEAAIMRLQDEGREAQMTGDALFAVYADVALILAEGKRRLAESKSMDDIPGFVSFDRKSADLVVKIGSGQFKLDLKGTVESNAQRYYEESKKDRRKLEGALAALQDARKALDALRKGQASRAQAVRAKHEHTKRFWFERYRWFISSEGAVVLGGKDAKSNDTLVKKHLDAGDRYAHADMHGAPSIVVKMREGITEKTLVEACEFAVATSKAWNAKIGSAAGYWVLPEQVSKTPQSGEYLAKGAFVIRGKRNYSNKIDIKLGIGEIEFEGQRKIMCGPEGAVRALSKRFAVIRPGERDKNAFAKQLSDLFQVPIEEIQSILPPGDVDIIDQVGLGPDLTVSR